MSIHSLDDIYTVLDAHDDRLQAIHGTLIAIAGGIEGLTYLLSEDLKERNPEAWERANQEVRKKSKDWIQMIREVSE